MPNDFCAILAKVCSRIWLVYQTCNYRLFSHLGNAARAKCAHHYFNLVSRHVESFISIATELGDRILYTDNELYSAVCSISAKKFEVAPKILDKTQKIEIAKDLHHKYNASNKQIKRVLRIDEAIIEELFPKNGGGGN